MEREKIKTLKTNMGFTRTFIYFHIVGLKRENFEKRFSVRFQTCLLVVPDVYLGSVKELHKNDCRWPTKEE